MVVEAANGHASFTVPGAAATEQNAFVVWRGTPTVAENWTVELLGHNSAVLDSCQLQLAVVDTEAWKRGEVKGFVLSRMNQGDAGTFGTSGWRAGEASIRRTRVSTLATEFRLRLVYRAGRRTLEAWYAPGAASQEWTHLDSMLLDDLSPGLGETHSLSIAVLGNTEGGPIPEGAIWIDDFRLSASPAPPANASLVPPEGRWSSMSEIAGTDEEVACIAVDPKGNVYAGGYFTTAGNVRAQHIARWDGTAWSSLGEGCDGPVSAVLLDGEDVYVGGDFRSAGGKPAHGVARWNGREWTPVGEGLTGGRVEALAFWDGRLIAGGRFLSSGSARVAFVAAWDGTEWAPLGEGVNYHVYSLATMEGKLFAAGEFSAAGGQPAAHVASWDGFSWSPLGTGLDDGVLSLAVSGSKLYAGGRFLNAGQLKTRYVAVWDGTAWAACGGGLDGKVRTLTAVGEGILAAGSVPGVAGGYTFGVARWDGRGWSTFGTLYGPVACLAADRGALYAGGNFDAADTGTMRHVARWSGTSWGPLGSGFDGEVGALGMYGTNLIAGGRFTRAGSSSVRSIASWDGQGWHGLGSGISGTVNALCNHEGKLVAGGFFREAGGKSVSHVARWDGLAWAPLGGGVDDGVTALAVLGSDLYAASGRNLARWQGTGWMSWASVNSGIDCLTPWGQSLYAGGVFTENAGVRAWLWHIAQWNGIILSPLGRGIGFQSGDSTRAMAVYGGKLLVGGRFDAAGNPGSDPSIRVQNLALWDGVSWSPVPGGTTEPVYSMATAGTAVYLATSPESHVVGQPWSRVHRWNGSEAKSVGSFRGGAVPALLANADYLYAGGSFLSVDGVPSACVARRRHGQIPPLVSVQPAESVWPIGERGYLWASVDSDTPCRYRWQRNGVDLSEGPGRSGVAEACFGVVDVQPGDAGSYRVIVANEFGATTSQVAQVQVGPPELHALRDYYYPRYPGNQWDYRTVQGSDTWTTRVRVEATYTPLAMWRGGMSPVSYQAIADALSYDQGGGRWTNYVAFGADAWGFLGSDEPSRKSRLRLDPGISALANAVAAGQASDALGDAYTNGVYLGPSRTTLRVIGLVDVEVPAGRYAKCLQVRVSVNYGSQTRIDEMWWAKGVGPVKWIHFDSPGSTAEINELTSMSLAGPPVERSKLRVQRFAGGVRLQLSAPASARYDLETTETLDPPAWTPILPLTVPTSGVWITNLPGVPDGSRFYRARRTQL